MASRSRSPLAPAMRCAAKTARERARSESSWRGSTRPTKAASSSAASPSDSPARATPWGQAWPWSIRSSRSARTCRWPRISASGACRRRAALSRSARCGAARRRCWRRSTPTLDVTRAVGSLTVGQQQMLQIASAIGQGARVIVFDEPTSSLSQHEAERLYSIIGRLRERGVTCIYVSHRLEEIFLLCDTITVLARRPARGDAARRRGRQGGARRDDDRPEARRVLSVARAGGVRRGAAPGRPAIEPCRLLRRVVHAARG